MVERESEVEKEHTGRQGEDIFCRSSVYVSVCVGVHKLICVNNYHPPCSRQKDCLNITSRCLMPALFVFCNNVKTPITPLLFLSCLRNEIKLNYTRFSPKKRKRKKETKHVDVFLPTPANGTSGNTL